MPRYRAIFTEPPIQFNRQDFSHNVLFAMPNRIFSVIQILQGTTTLRLLLVVLSAPVLDGHSLLRGNREQLEESLTLMLQDQTRFMGRQRQINLLHCVVICLFGINSE